MERNSKETLQIRRKEAHLVIDKKLTEQETSILAATSSITARTVTARARTESIHFDSRISIRQRETKIKKWFWCARCIKIFFFVHLGEFIHFDSLRITFASRIMIHLRIKKQIESKIQGRWIVIHSFGNHWLIRSRIESESKWIAKKAGPSPGHSPYWENKIINSMSKRAYQRCEQKKIFKQIKILIFLGQDFKTICWYKRLLQNFDIKRRL